MSTAETQERRSPGLVPVTETMRSAERRPPEPPGVSGAAAGPPAVGVLAAARLRTRPDVPAPAQPGDAGRLASVPVLIGIALRIASGDEAVGGLIGAVAGNSLMLTFASFSFLVLLLMPIAVSVVGGDSIAGEAGAGTLRYLLAAPAGRTRLLVVKYLNAVVFAYAVTAVVALSALVTGLILFPVGPVTLLSGSTSLGGRGPAADPDHHRVRGRGHGGAGGRGGGPVDVHRGVHRRHRGDDGPGHRHPGAAGHPAARRDHALPAAQLVDRFDAVLRSPVDFAGLGQGLLVFGAYILLFGSIAWARFSGKDITS